MGFRLWASFEIPPPAQSRRGWMTIPQFLHLTFKSTIHSLWNKSGRESGWFSARIRRLERRDVWRNDVLITTCVLERGPPEPGASQELTTLNVGGRLAVHFKLCVLIRWRFLLDSRVHVCHVPRGDAAQWQLIAFFRWRTSCCHSVWQRVKD